MGKKGEAKKEVSTKVPSKALPSRRFALCIPSSIISASNAKNLEQITYVAYQVAKAATIYNVVEVVILDIPSPEEQERLEEREATKVVLLSSDKGGKKIKFNLNDKEAIEPPREKDSQADDYTSRSSQHVADPNNGLLFATLLQFFMTPPYLVKAVFGSSEFLSKLKYARKLPKISTLPFMGNNNVFSDFKEGLTVPKKALKIKKKNKKPVSRKFNSTKYVNIGLDAPLVLSLEVPVNVRVTVDIKNKKVVSPAQAYGVVGAHLAFGYHVRLCKKFSAVFTECSIPAGYTQSIYVRSDDYFSSSATAASKLPAVLASSMPAEGTILLVVGNIKDLDYSFALDKQSFPSLESSVLFFDGQLPVPDSTRIEDAALIALSKLSD